MFRELLNILCNISVLHNKNFVIFCMRITPWEDTSKWMFLIIIFAKGNKFINFRFMQNG